MGPSSGYPHASLRFFKMQLLLYCGGQKTALFERKAIFVHCATYRFYTGGRWEQYLAQKRPYFSGSQLPRALYSARGNASSAQIMPFLGQILPSVSAGVKMVCCAWDESIIVDVPAAHPPFPGIHFLQRHVPGHCPGMFLVHMVPFPGTHFLQ